VSLPIQQAHTTKISDQASLINGTLNRDGTACYGSGADTVKYH